MVGDFKIRDSNWDPFFPHHSIHCDLFNNIVDSMDLCLSKSTNQILTRYSDNQNDSNLVIDLIFFQPNSSKLNNDMIYPKWRLSSDHVPLTVEIVIIEEHVQTVKIVDSGLYFIFHFHFYFTFLSFFLIFYF